MSGCMLLLLMGIGWGGLLPLQEVIWASVFGRRYLGSVRSTAMPFTYAMSALGPILVASYYDLAGSYDSPVGHCGLQSRLCIHAVFPENPLLPLSHAAFAVMLFVQFQKGTCC